MLRLVSADLSHRQWRKRVYCSRTVSFIFLLFFYLNTHLFSLIFTFTSTTPTTELKCIVHHYKRPGAVGGHLINTETELGTHHLHLNALRWLHLLHGVPVQFRVLSQHGIPPVQALVPGNAGLHVHFCGRPLSVADPWFSCEKRDRCTRTHRRCCAFHA